jgi:hypothetical protein
MKKIKQDEKIAETMEGHLNYIRYREKLKRKNGKNFLIFRYREKK